MNSATQFSAGSDQASPPSPVDLSHHFAFVARNRIGSDVKKFYKYFLIPGIHNLAGGAVFYFAVGRWD